MSKTHLALEKATADSKADGRFKDGRFKAVPKPEVVDQAPPIEWLQGRKDDLAFQQLGVWLTNSALAENRPQALLVTGCRGSVGTTTVTALLAATLAQGNKFRVLVVDANVRRPALNRVFQATRAEGLTDALAGHVTIETTVQGTNQPNLYVLTSGAVSTGPAELLDRATIDELMTRLREKFNFIVVDSAPVLDFPDACSLAPRVDGTLLVVGAEQT